MKKFLVAFIALGLLVGYVRKHYTFQDVLVYSKKKADPKLSPKLDYYVGMAGYLRDDIPVATAAFEQLLADYPTCQYAPKSLFRLSGIYAEQRNWEPARVVLQRYMEEYPTGPDIEAARNRYEFIKFK